MSCGSATGATGGTSLVKDIYAGSGSSSPASLTVVGKTLYFKADDGSGHNGWWAE